MADDSMRTVVVALGVALAKAAAAAVTGSSALAAHSLADSANDLIAVCGSASQPPPARRSASPGLRA
jgi:divalent metal cation (Fe/Co/Zn/Cd) transporter